MKIKKLLPVMIFFIITILAYIVATILFCYTTEPKVIKHEFPFSITYEYKGEIETFSGIFECEYSGSKTIGGEHYRYWEGETKYENSVNPEKPNIVEENDELQTMLAVQENMSAGYFMGDPLYQDDYKAYDLEGPEPRIEYYDYKNDISLDDENREEILKSIGFKIIDFTYAEPIENSFSFSGISYEADNVLIFIAILSGFFLLCLVFIRKEKEKQYSTLDKAGIFLNFLVGIFAVPFISVVCILFGIAESNVELINQITYNIPSIAILCLALSVVLRRKGFSRSGFFIQFGGILTFVLMIILETIL